MAMRPARAANHNMKVTIDRIEDGIMVLETDDGKIIELDSILGLNEGDVLDIFFNENGSILSCKKDETETVLRSQRAKERLSRLFNKN